MSGSANGPSLPRPLLLDDESRVLRVVSGAADLFLVQRGGHGTTGARHPLGRVEAGGLLLPFPGHHRWTVLAVAILGSVIEEAGWQDADGPREQVLEHQKHLLEEAVQEVERREASFGTRLAEQDAADRLLMSEAMEALADVTGGDVAAVSPSLQEPVLAACRLVAESMGITLRGAQTEPAEPADPQSAVQAGLRRIAEIARTSGIRSRQVVLEGAWWRSDAGPLVGFDRDGRPLALLRHPTGYRAVDPSSGAEQRVDARSAEDLAPHAVVFYRSFPDHPLTAGSLLRFGFRGLGRDLATAGLMGLLGGGLGLLPPIVLGKLVDVVLPAAEQPQLLQLVGILVAAALGVAMFGIVRAVAMVRLESRMDADVQAAVWDRVLALPMPFFQRFNAGDLANRAMGVNAIRQAISGSTTTALLAGVFSLLQVILMVHYGPRLAVVGLLVVGVTLAVTVAAGMMELRLQRRISDLGGHLAGKVLQIVKAVAKLRGAGAERRAFAYWADDFARQRRLVYRARLATAVNATVTAVAPVLASLALFATYSAAAEGSGPVPSSGDFLAFMAAFAAFSAGTLHAGSTLVGLLRVIPIFERARPILRAVPESAGDRPDAGELEGDIEVAHVCYRYHDDGPEVLHDVSLRVAPGESVAIVGPSGAGKSTLLRLMLGFDEPTSGAVYYDSHSLADLDPRSVRRQVGVVLQGGQLLGGDIFANIVGAQPLTIDDAWEAAKMAGLAADIEAMPMGMHTLIGEGGGNLSGGQRQRLMIAKALVHRPRLIFFDEATSALDNPTQAQVAESLERLRATRVLIAHRLSTIRHADRIYVLEAGRIAESGTYDELMAAGGIFADLARRQIA